MFSFTGNKIQIQETLYYTADGQVILSGLPVSGQCGWDDEEPRRVIVGGSATLTTNSDYFLECKTIPDKAVTPPGYSCLLTRFRKDVTGNLEGLVNKLLESNCKKMDESVSKATNFKPYAELIWKFLSQPFALNDGRYLTINPKEFSLSDINFKDGDIIRVNTTLGLKYNPKLTNTLPSPPPPLPALNTTPCNPNFELEYDLSSKLSDFNKSDVIANHSIYNRKFETDNRFLKIRNISYSYKGDKFYVRLQIISRPKLPQNPNIGNKFKYGFEKIFYRRRGYINIEGNLSEQEYCLGINSCDFDEATKSEIRRKAKWIISTDILNYIQSNLKVDHKYEILNTLQQIDKNFNNKIDRNIVLTNTSVTSIVKDKFYYMDDFVIRFKFVATPKIDIYVP